MEIINMHYILEELKLIRKGKVREVYEAGKDILFVASDRISAFDVIMAQPVADKGKILTAISEYWFHETKSIIDNHFISSNINDLPSEITEKHSDMLAGRSMLVKKAEPLPIEFVVRGYLAGSGWKEYKLSKSVCGISLPDGLLEYSKLPEPIFTPATKAETGHDENISYKQASEILGEETASYLRTISIKLYNFAHQRLYEKGIILADTKFEFGKDDKGNLILIDEALTPDSSRFWLMSDYVPGKPQMNFDKQILRDYLESIPWNKQYPPPNLPEKILRGTLEKYAYAYELITGNKWQID
ncbi:MAG: phosphoribosylaminoimidazolesuccinocarboxamide synthase [Candidatus Kapabacteria bacterium]|nr:phosphoribosylaminoimidazolesuccinocarboxamide synthase [Ignavibacteriota bacterium]MCW5885828.1 phosphoribosylaminoimidazolesuccinocarboxamide synthase [Candidatus Kapabacteria bacterium]